MILQPTNLLLLALAADDTGSTSSSAGALSAARLKLINSNTPTLNGGTNWGSVSPWIGGYDGYGDGTMTWTPPFLPQGGGVGVISNETTFRPTDSSFSVSGWGLVLTDPGSSSVYAAGPFDDPPIGLATPLNQLQCTLIFNPATASFQVEYTY